MDVDRIVEILDRRLAADEGGDLLDDVGGMGAIDVASQQLAILGDKELEQSLRLLHRHGLAIAAIERLAHGVGRVALLQLVLGGTHAGCLRIGEDGAGDDVEADAVGLAQDMVDGTQALCLGGMGELDATVDVADGIDAGDVGLHVVIDGDALAVVGNASSLQVEVVHVGAAARGDEDDVGFQIDALTLALEGHDGRVAALSARDGADVLDATLHVELDAALLQRLAHALGDVGVDGRETLLEKLHHRHLAAKRLEGGGKLHADHAGTDDAEAARHEVDVEELRGGHDVAADVGIVVHEGQDLRLRTRGDEDVLGRVLLATDLDGVGIDEVGLAPDEGDAGLGEQRGDTRDELGHDLVFALQDGLEVDAVLRLRHQRVAIEVGVVGKALRGDAAHVEARATQFALLDDHDLEAVLGSIAGGMITARSCSDDDQISRCHAAAA